MDAAAADKDLRQRPPGYIALYDRVLAQWIDSWLPEFVGDMVATYLVGPAFGWQHIRPMATIPAFLTHFAGPAGLAGIKS
jgi:hypothetical protein